MSLLEINDELTGDMLECILEEIAGQDALAETKWEYRYHAEAIAYRGKEWGEAMLLFLTKGISDEDYKDATITFLAYHTRLLRDLNKPAEELVTNHD